MSMKNFNIQGLYGEEKNIPFFFMLEIELF